MSAVLVTGANGFVGRTLCQCLEASGKQVRRAMRRPGTGADFVVGDIGPATDWQLALEGCTTVIHLAARVHVMQDTATDPLAAFREVNTFGTLNLARQAARQGVRRLVFVSSVKVNGESGAFTGRDQPAPEDPYGCSKAEAELGLQAISKETGIEIVVVRPPLVYGPGVGANFLRLVRAVERGLPLPFGAVENQRSLVYIGNLASAIAICADHPAAAGKTYLVSDGSDVSTKELVQLIARQLGRSPRLVGVPAPLLRLAGRVFGKQQEIERLLGSLTVDSGEIRRDLGWMPPFTLEQGLEQTIEWYRRTDDR